MESLTRNQSHSKGKIEKSVAALIFALCVLFSVGSFSCSRQPAQKYLRSGAKAESDGEFHKAVKEYTRVLSYSDQKAAEMALQRLGFINETYFKDYKAAIVFYQQLSSRHPPQDVRFDVMKRIATIQKDFLNDYENAIISWSNLLDQFGSHPDVDQFQFQLAKSYMAAKRFEQARVEFNKLVKNHPRSELRVKTELEIAKSHYEESNYPLAEKEIKAFISNYPNEVESNEAKFFLAHVFEENDDLKNAVLIYQDLLNSYQDPELIRFKLERLENRIKVRGR